jgi:hypothetical protein
MAEEQLPLIEETQAADETWPPAIPRVATPGQPPQWDRKMVCAAWSLAGAITALPVLIAALAMKSNAYPPGWQQVGVAGAALALVSAANGCAGLPHGRAKWALTVAVLGGCLFYFVATHAPDPSCWCGDDIANNVANGS